MGKKSFTKAPEKSDTAAKAEAVQRGRQNARKQKKDTMTYVWIGLGGAFVLFTVFLAATGGSGGKRTQATSKLDEKVNDYYFIRDTNNNADGNFTAAASPFFDRWTHADLKWGLQGVGLSGMVGMPGAIQRCEDEKDVEGGALPVKYDLREKFPNCFSEVYDSGNCTSSYAIAATSTVALRYCVADYGAHPSLRLSPQQILSCDKKSRGCKGGGADGVWAYVQRRGLYPEECVPYAGNKGAQCKTDCEESRKFHILDHCVLNGDTKKIKREIFNKGPLHAPMFLTDEFLVYKDGVFTPTPRGLPVYDEFDKPIVHVVTLIGWGKHEGQSYWVIGNSWGTGWGEDGYARVAMGVLHEGYLISVVPATEENKAEVEKLKAEKVARLEELKKERAARDARIAEREAERAAERAAQQSEEDDDDVDLDVDLDDIETDPDLDDEPDEVNVDDDKEL